MHTKREKQKLLNRVKRIRDQVEAIQRAIGDERDCSDVLHLVAACRGAMTGLMTEVIEGHIRFHVVDPSAERSGEHAEAAEELIAVLRAYLK